MAERRRRAVPQPVPPGTWLWHPQLGWVPQAPVGWAPQPPAPRARARHVRRGHGGRRHHRHGLGHGAWALLALPLRVGLAILRGLG